MQIQEINVNKIKEYANNAKKHPEKQVQQIANSIKKFGFRQPLVLDKNMEIVIGHGRFAAAKMLHMETVPCVMADDLTDEQIKALRIADNKTNESEWDLDLLEEELEVVDLSDFGFEFFDEKQEKKKEYEGEVEFSKELLLSHNYIVLYFDNDFDWEVAQDKFGLRKVKDLIPRKGQPVGVGRVIDGKRILEWKEN